MTIESRLNKFKLVGGASILDFVNTVSARVDKPGQGPERKKKAFRTEKLGEFIDLLAWIKKAGLLDQIELEALSRAAVNEPKQAATTLKRIVQLREVIYRLLKAVSDNVAPDVEDLRKFNNELRRLRKHENLVHRPNGYGLEWEDGNSSFDSLVWMLTTAAADFLVSDMVSMLKQCHGENCGWMFIDTSRGGTRKWCDMAECGTLAKVRRFRTRHRKSIQKSTNN